MSINSQEQTLSRNEKQSLNKAKVYLKAANNSKDQDAVGAILDLVNKGSPKEEPLTRMDLINFAYEHEPKSKEDIKAADRLNGFFKNKENSGKAMSLISQQMLSRNEKQSLNEAKECLKTANNSKDQHAVDVILHHANKGFPEEESLTRMDLIHFAYGHKPESEKDIKAAARLNDFFKNKENSVKAISTTNFFRQAEKSVDKDFILGTLKRKDKLNEIWNTSYKNFKNLKELSPLVGIIKSETSPSAIVMHSAAQFLVGVPLLVAFGGITTATAAAVSGIGLAAQAVVSAAYNSVNGYKATTREEKFIKAANKVNPPELQRTIEGGRVKRTVKQVGQSLLAANSKTSGWERAARIAASAATLGITAAASSAAKGRMHSAATNALLLPSEREMPQTSSRRHTERLEARQVSNTGYTEMFGNTVPFSQPNSSILAR